MFESIKRSKISTVFLILGPIVVALSLLLFQISAVQSAAGLTVEIIAGYNLVVDSNVESPSTEAPSVATVAARFCNPDTNTDTLQDVIGYIGDFTGDLTTSTPGIYPVRDSSDPAFISEHPLLANSGLYSYTHLGDLSDATRYIGDLAPGVCSVQYWSFTYPRCEGNQTPPCTDDPVFGVRNDLGDDLHLDFDVWGWGTDPSDQSTKSASDLQTQTMRSEISAAANQIWPNGGSWFNTENDTVLPGDVITSNGVNYTFGQVSGGFDNDGDGEPDNNAWIQPFGEPTYDPTCFRLVRTTGTLTVDLTGGDPDLIIDFTDTLYFKLPANNTNVTGVVQYTFLALDGPCTAAMSPYQEAASGNDNEKFNSDYEDNPVPPISTLPTQATVDKTAPASVEENNIITYNIAFANNGDAPIGLTLDSGIPVNMPFVIQDTVPDGLSYVCGSPSASLGYTMLYSKDSGLTWSSNEADLWPECATAGTPTTQVSTGPDDRIIIQWRLTDPLPPHTNGTATYQAYVPVGYLAGGGSSPIDNTACIKLDSVGTDLACDNALTTVTPGVNSLDGTVFFDQVNQDGIQDPEDTTVFANITINLWFCGFDGNCATTADNYYMGSTVTDSAGNYTFSNLPDGIFSVSIDQTAPSISLMTLTSDSPQTASLDPTHASAVPVSDTHDFGLYAYMDCGDLYDTYNYRTSLSVEGPCHVSPSSPDPVNPDTYLGVAWDADLNGQGTTGSALGDDMSISDDEDGVEPYTPYTGWASGTTQQIQVTVVGTGAYLAGWFDWNNDYDFVTATGEYDPGEFIDFGPVLPGISILDVPIPLCTDTCFTDDSYATLYVRFRLYSGTPTTISHTGLAANGEVEDYQWTNAPTAITLASFSAEFVPMMQVVVQWQTTLELDAIGFNLYRATSLDGERTQLNNELILSQSPGGLGGAAYEFIDSNVLPGETYYYWLVFIDTSGETVFGPLQVLVSRTIFLPFVRR